MEFKIPTPYVSQTFTATTKNMYKLFTLFCVTHSVCGVNVESSMYPSTEYTEYLTSSFESFTVSPTSTPSDSELATFSSSNSGPDFATFSPTSSPGVYEFEDSEDLDSSTPDFSTFSPTPSPDVIEFEDMDSGGNDFSTFSPTPSPMNVRGSTLQPVVVETSSASSHGGVVVGLVLGMILAVGLY